MKHLFILRVLVLVLLFPTALFASSLIEKKIDENGQEEIAQPQADAAQQVSEPVVDDVPIGSIVNGLSRYSVLCSPDRVVVLVVIHEKDADVPYYVEGKFEAEKLKVTYTKDFVLNFGMKSITTSKEVESFITDRPKKIEKDYKKGYQELQIECKYPDLKKATNKIMPVEFLPTFPKLLVEELQNDLFSTVEEKKE